MNFLRNILNFNSGSNTELNDNDMITSHARLLKNMSSEQLSQREFLEYIKDYSSNPEEYGIDEDSDYMNAINYAVQFPYRMYEAYCKNYE